MLSPRQHLGAQGEALAAHWLEGQGYRIVARNWRAKQLELDIVARHADTLVFVEVKTRTHGGMGSPVEAVSSHKQRSLIQAGRAYLAAHSLWQAPCRFDIIAIIRLEASETSASVSSRPTFSAAPQQPDSAASGVHILPWDGATFSVEHYPHAFELPSALDCGNTARQPW